MGKIRELASLLDDLKKCGETLIGISDQLTDLFSRSEDENPVYKAVDKIKSESMSEENISNKKSVTLEDVRAVLAAKSRAGFTGEVKAIITKHGADKLSDIDPVEFESVLAEAETIGNAN